MLAVILVKIAKITTFDSICPVCWALSCKGSHFFKRQSKYGHCPNWLIAPPSSILGIRRAILRVNRNILQNATKQRKTSFCWLLKMYKAFKHRPFFQNFKKVLSGQNSKKSAPIFLAGSKAPPPPLDILPKF